MTMSTEEPLVFDPFAFSLHDDDTDWRVCDHKARFHSTNVTGWTSLPITFSPGRRSTP